MVKDILSLFKQSVIYGIGTIFERLLSFLMLPLFLNTLSEEEFGLYVLWFSYVMIASPIYLFGQNSAIIRFYPPDSTRHQQATIFSTAFWAVAGVASGLSLLGLIASQPLTSWLFGPEVGAKFTWCLAGCLWFDALNLLALNWLKAENRALSFTLISIIAGLAIPVFTLYFIVWLKWAVWGAILAVLLAAAFKFLLLFFVVIRKTLRWSFSMIRFREMSRFGLPFVPTVLAASLMVAIDRILLDRIFGKAMVGIYGAGFRLAMIISLFTKAFQYAWEPFITVTSNQKNAAQLYARIFTYFVLVISLIYLTIALFVEEIVRLRLGPITFFGAEYFESTRVVPIIMLGSVFYGIYLNFIVGIYVHKKSIYFPLLTGVGAGINFVLNYLLIPQYEILGAAWATVGAYGIMMLWMYFLNQKYFPIHYEFVRLIKLGLVLSFILVLPTWSVHFQNVTFKMVLLLLVPIFLLLLRFFEKNELVHFKKLAKGSRWPHLSL